MPLADGPKNLKNNSILLSEWATMNQRIDNIDARIWQGAGILLVLSIGGFSFINWSLPPSLMGFFSVITISIASLVILYIWLHVFHRWIYVQAILGHRAREIEQELGLRFHRYARTMEYWKEDINNIKDEETKAFISELKEHDTKSYNNILKFRNDQRKKKLGRTSIRKSLTWLTVLLMIMWFSVIISHSTMLVLGNSTGGNGNGNTDISNENSNVTN